MNQTPASASDRIFVTPGNQALNHFFYAQETGTLTSLRPHISKREALDSFLFLVVKSGHGYFTYAGSRTILLPGDCVYIDCKTGYSHESSSDDPWTLKWVHFNGKECSNYYEQYEALHYSHIFHPKNTDFFLQTLDELHSNYKNENLLTDITANYLLCSILTQAFCQNAIALTGDDSNQDSDSNKKKRKLNDVREYISSQIEKNASPETLSLENLANTFYISKFYLLHQYKEIFGVTIGNDIVLKRMAKAKSLLRFTDHSVENIAEECGFASSGYFIKVFKRYEKLTPGEYRSTW